MAHHYSHSSDLGVRRSHELLRFAICNLRSCSIYTICHDLELAFSGGQIPGSVLSKLVLHWTYQHVCNPTFKYACKLGHPNSQASFITVLEQQLFLQSGYNLESAQ